MKKQTPVQWLYDQIGDTAPYEYAAQIASYLEEAMKMEEEQSKELSDKDILDKLLKDMIEFQNEKGIKDGDDFIFDKAIFIDKMQWNLGFMAGAEWYREQLKQRQ